MKCGICKETERLTLYHIVVVMNDGAQHKNSAFGLYLCWRCFSQINRVGLQIAEEEEDEK